LVEGGKGNRQRTAKMAMDVCRRAWRVAFREKPGVVPSENPFAQMGLSYRPKVTRADTYDELISFVKKADALGYRSIGTAALIAFFWLQREEDIFLRLSWTNYRPADAPLMVRIFHHKNGELVDVPLIDQDGSDLWPDLVPRLDRERRLGTLIVMRDGPDPKRKVHLPWATSVLNPVRHVQRMVAHIRTASPDTAERSQPASCQTSMELPQAGSRHDRRELYPRSRVLISSSDDRISGARRI
jgi:hypothetical protein